MSQVREEWAAWGERVYGPGGTKGPQWRETNRRYWCSRWVPRHCLWCRKPHNPPETYLQLNHLTYWTTKWRQGWTPKVFFVPLCDRCHKLETAWTRKVRRILPVGEHVIATFGVYALSRAVILGLLWVMIQIVGARV